MACVGKLMAATPLSARPIYPFLWLAPAFAILIAVLVYPWLWSGYLTVFKWNPIRQQPPTFVGLQNFIDVFSNPRFLHALRRTLILAAIHISASLGIGLLVSMVLNSGIRWQRFFRVAVMFPLVLTPVAVGLMWRIILHEQWGILNYLLSWLGLRKVEWLSNPSLTLPVITVVHTWRQSPFMVLILLAALQSLPTEHIEAAVIDGATRRQQFWYIILPWLRPATVVGILFLSIFALRVFAIVLSIYGGPGPGNAGELLGVYLYEHFRKTWEFGTTSAISYSLLLLTLLLGLTIIKTLYVEHKE